jgi:superfamily II DNA/RNA helicase
MIRGKCAVLLCRYTTLTKKYLNKTKPLASQTLVDEILKGDKEHGIQFIAASATLDSACRRTLKLNGWFNKEDAVLLNLSGSATSPTGVTHSCLVKMSDGTFRDINMDIEKERDESVPVHVGKQSGKKDTVRVEPKFIDISSIRKIADHYTSKTDALGTGLVFSHSGLSVKSLVEKLVVLGVPTRGIDAVSFDGEQGIKEQLFEERGGLVCIDEHSSRGIDVDGVEIVWVIGAPVGFASYLHMSGRCGRMGGSGRCVVLIGEEEEQKMAGMYKLLGVVVEKFEADEDELR